MQVQINPCLLSGETGVITSKSYYIRALILAALSLREVRLYGENDSTDVTAAVDALNALGVKVSAHKNGFSVKPQKEWPSSVTLSVGESATLLRILIPVLAAKGITAKICAEDSLKKRPVASLINALSAHGVTFQRKTFPLSFSGQLTADKYVVYDTATSGVISGLIIALSALDGNSEIVADLNSFNKGYIDITLDTLSVFGGRCETSSLGVKIEGGVLNGIKKYTVEADWSNAAVWLVAGALCGNVTVTSLNLVSAQYDRKIIEYLSAMNADISMGDNSVSARKSCLRAINCDLGQNLDIVPVLAVACAAAEGVSVLKNVSRLALKESDRIAEIVRLLDALSVRAEYKDGDLTVYGGTLHAKEDVYRAPKDHRIIMAAAIAGAVCGIKIEGAEAVNKSYPAFFNDFMKLGGDLRYADNRK